MLQLHVGVFYPRRQRHQCDATDQRVTNLPTAPHYPITQPENNKVMTKTTNVKCQADALYLVQEATGEIFRVFTARSVHVDLERIVGGCGEKHVNIGERKYAG
jgi:hypothetical protein